MRGFFLNIGALIFFVTTIAWIIILVLKNTQHKGFLKGDKDLRYGKILAYLLAFGVWIALFLLFLSSAIIPKASLVGKIIEEEVDRLVPDINYQQIEESREILDKEKEMERTEVMQKEIEKRRENGEDYFESLLKGKIEKEEE